MDTIQYEVNVGQISMTEQKNEKDVSFVIRAKNGEALNRLHQLRLFFESDKSYTDIMFYARKERTYQVIVRREAYVPFVVHLFQLQLLTSVRWLKI